MCEHHSVSLLFTSLRRPIERVLLTSLGPDDLEARTLVQHPTEIGRLRLDLAVHVRPPRSHGLGVVWVQGGGYHRLEQVAAPQHHLGESAGSLPDLLDRAVDVVLEDDPARPPAGDQIWLSTAMRECVSEVN